MVKKKTNVNNDERILLTPPEIDISPGVSVDYPIVITNKYPFPVFMVVFKIEVQEGDIDLQKDFLPFGTGLGNSKCLTCQIPQLNSGETYTHIWKINDLKLEKESKLKLSIAGYSKTPVPDFSIKTDTFPKTMKIPKGLIPKIYKNN